MAPRCHPGARLASPKQTTPCGPIAPQELQAFFILLAVSKLMLLAYACSIIRVTVHGAFSRPVRCMVEQSYA